MIQLVKIEIKPIFLEKMKTLKTWLEKLCCQGNVKLTYTSRRL